MKHRLLFLIFFISLFSCAYARELWNGFTTEMNYDQVVALIQKKYGLKSYSKRTDFFGPFLTYPDGYKIWSGEVDYKMIRYSFYIDDVAISEIHAAFLYGRLFAICIHYTANENVVLDKAESRFGKPELYLRSKKWFSDEYEIVARGWIRNEIIIVLIGSECTYTDEAKRLQLIDLYNECEERRRQEALELERKKNDGIVF